MRVLRLIAFALLLDIVWSCSRTSICVRHDGQFPGAYTLDIGNGPITRLDLILEASVPYTFTALGNGFNMHPFAITLSPHGPATSPWVEGVSGDYPLALQGQSFIFIPSSTGRDLYYYQAVNSLRMGSKIMVINTCQPTDSNICVRFDDSSTTPHFILQYEISTLHAAKSYTFEVVGPMFEQYPFWLTSNPKGRWPEFSTSSNSSEDSLKSDLITPYIRGRFPLAADNQQLTFTPPQWGPSLVYYYNPAQPDDIAIGGQLAIYGACLPSKTHICVSWENNAFAVNMGDGPRRKDVIHLQSGNLYTFQTAGGNFQDQPFALTLVKNGPAQPPYIHNVAGANPCEHDGDIMSFLPDPLGPSLLYYHSMNGADLGGSILIANACEPSKTNICFTWDSRAQNFAVDTGDGPVIGGDLSLEAGIEYTLEVVGDEFAQHPLSLFTTDGQVVTRGVSGKNPAIKDDDKIIYLPPTNSPQEIVYKSTAVGDFGRVGGKIFHTCICHPKPDYICVFIAPVDGPLAPGQNRTYRYVLDNGSRQGAFSSGNMTVSLAPVAESSTSALQLDLGKAYTFQMVCNMFIHFPFALTEDRTLATTPVTLGVSGWNPAYEDQDQLILDTSLYQPLDSALYLPGSANADGLRPYNLYFQSVVIPNMGGTLRVIDPKATSISRTPSNFPVSNGDSPRPPFPNNITSNDGEGPPLRPGTLPSSLPSWRNPTGTAAGTNNHDEPTSNNNRDRPPSIPAIGDNIGDAIGDVIERTNQNSNDDNANENHITTDTLRSTDDSSSSARRSAGSTAIALCLSIVFTCLSLGFA